MENLLAQVKTKADFWLSDTFDNSTQLEVADLLKPENEAKLVDAFYKNLEFGTGGLRGIMGAGTNRMNIYTVGLATQGFANYLKKEFKSLKDIKVVVGHDVRNNSRLFAETTANIFSANGFKVYLFEDFRPTPEISYAIRLLGCQAGVNVTASHNPKEYNGYKAYWNDGAQLMPPHDNNVIKEVERTKVEDILFTPIKENISIVGDDIDKLYIGEVLKQSLSPDLVKEHSAIKILYTPIHGVGVKIIPQALKKFGFKNIFNVPEQDITSGDFPTVVSPNPEEKAAMKMALDKAKEIDADLILASDPDADRIGVGIKNSKGEFILLDGNQTAAIITYYLASRFKELKKLKGNEFMVKTIVTSDLLSDIITGNGIECIECYTGFKYIAELIRENEGKKKYIGGGEESFGYLVGDYVRDKDAVSACCIMAEIAVWAKSKGFTLFELLLEMYQKFGFYKEISFNLTKKGKDGVEEINKMMKDFRSKPPTSIGGSKLKYLIDYAALVNRNVMTGNIAEVPFQYTSNVLQYITMENIKVSVRPSGTEPKIKLYVSFKTTLKPEDDFYEKEKEVAEKIQIIAKELGF